MKRFFTRAGLVLLLAFGTALSARAQDDQYVKAFNLILNGDGLRDQGQGRAALAKFIEAEAELKKIKAAHPAWNPKIVKFRLDYVADRIAPLLVQFPGPPPAAVVQPAGKSPAQVGLEAQVSRMNDEMVRLRTDKAKLEAQLKEALAARPADVDPARLAAADQKIKTLQREVDLQRISLDQQTQTLGALTKEKQSLQTRIDSDKTAGPALKKDNEELRKQVAALAKDNKKMETLLTDPDFQAGPPNEKLAAMEKELKSLKEANDLNQAKVDLLVKDKAVLETKLQDSSGSLAKIKQLERERDDLAKKLGDALKAAEKKN